MRKRRQCPFCNSVRMRKMGFHKVDPTRKIPNPKKQQRWECKNCRRTTVVPKIVEPKKRVKK